MSRNLDIGVLRTFLTVADASGMTAAAARLNVTQAAVSLQIKRLEESLDAQVFERDRRGMRLTPAGERLYGMARRLVALNDETWAEMTAPSEQGEVRLGVPYDLVNTYLPPVLKRFASAFPRARLSLTSLPSTELRTALYAGDVDLALIEDPAPTPGDEVLAVDRLVWVGAKGGEACRKRPLPVSFGSEACIFRPAVQAALTTAGIPWWPVSEIGSMEALNATVHTDLAVMSLLRSTVPPTLIVLGPDADLPPLPQFSICLHIRKTDVSRLTQALADHIRTGLVASRAA